MNNREKQQEDIANGLADRGYSIVDNFLLPEEVGKILALEEFQKPLGSFKKAGIGIHQERQIQEQIRGDYIQWIDPQNTDTAIRCYSDALTDLMGYINRALFLSLKDFEIHKTVYPVGAFYRRHLDQFKTDDHRKLSAIFYLNENWSEKDGGHLRMYLADGPKDVLPVAGRLVCFRSDQIEHEVLPAKRPRLSITGWILDQYNDLRHL